MIDSKAQHEIAGFVLIVLIVSIIGVVFLSIAYGGEDNSKQTSIEISNLLEASMYSTTSCAINYIPQYRDMQDLIKDCYKHQTGSFRECLDGRDICEVLRDSLKKAIDSGLFIGKDSPNKAYKLDMYFTYGNDVDDEEIISFNEGDFSECSSVVGGGHSIAAGSFGFGIIEIELTVCKS